MKVAGYNIPFRSIAWFDGREPANITEVILEARNAAECKHRLTWLAEGSLMYQLERMRGKWTDGGCPEEKKLFRQFVSELARRGHQI